MSYERASLTNVHPYVPGEQPADGQSVKLNTNENPYPPADAVLQAIAAVSGDQLRRYPPPTAEPFRKLAARTHGVSPDMVIATNGGDELLRLAVTAFCEPQADSPQGGIGITDPTYSLYHTLAATGDVGVVRVPLAADWSLPADLVEQFTQGGCRLIMLVNPHAPTGRLRSVDQLGDIARALRGRAVLLIDEAYVDFADRDAVCLLDAGLDNLLLLRTLSKGYSLAGLRLGYGLGHRDLITVLDKARDSFNTDVLSQAAAAAALEHRDAAAQSWQAVQSERTAVTESLSDRGFDVPASQSNFILVTPPATGRDARSIYESLKQRSIFVRYFDQDRLRDKLRITIGTPQQNKALLAAIDEIM